jgi:hypothetical protein
MDSKIVEKISGQIYSRFPEVSGSRPSVQSQAEDTYLLIFKGAGTTADGKRIQRTVRVVASGSGKIIKVTTSR